MNELQIRLTADIKDLQSALNKAKASLKSFESETATDSEKSNVGFRRKIGLIEQLTAKAKGFKVAISQATNEQQIAKFNAQLEETNQELARLNALGKSFANSGVKSFDNLKRSSGAATGSAIAFSRIIQDAPFGIIGVANNIQNFGEQFAALGGKAATAGQKLSSFFTALIQPANLAILAVSALTAAWQAYSLGLFDSKEKTEDLSKELEDFKNSLDGISKAQLEGAQSAQKEIQAFQLLTQQAENANLPLEKRLRAVEEIKKQFPDYLKGLTDEEILLGKVGNAYVEITKSLTSFSTAQALSGQIGENNAKIIALEFQERERALVIAQKQLDLEEAKRNTIDAGARVAGQFTATNSDAVLIQAEINKLTNQTLESADKRVKLERENLFINSKIPEQIQKAGGLIDENNDKVDKAKEKVEFYDKAWNENEDRLIRINQLLKAIADETPAPAEIKPEEDPADVTPKGKIEALEEQIALFEFLKRLQTDTGKIDEYTVKIAQLRQELALLNGEQVKSNLELVADAFGSLASGIVASLDISNRSLRGFLTTLISATPKIIAAMSAQANSNLSNAGKNIAADKAESISSGIKQGTKFAEALGPVGLALLPVFIAGAVAVISSAFGKAGSGGSVSSGSGSTYTNRREFGGPVSKGRAYIVGERRPELFVPNTNGIIVPQVPSMDYSGASVNSGMYGVEVMLKGPDDLLFFVEQAQIRRNIR
jgi:hypothetical protein